MCDLFDRLDNLIRDGGALGYAPTGDDMVRVTMWKKYIFVPGQSVPEPDNINIFCIDVDTSDASLYKAISYLLHI